MTRCPCCGTTPLRRIAARLAWWLRLTNRVDVTHRYCR